MRIVLDWKFSLPDTEGWDEERRLKVMKGVADTLSGAQLLVGKVPVKPHEIILYNNETAMPVERTEAGKQVQVGKNPNTLCIILDVDTRTEFV